ncbi:hypothetical protein [Microbacterium sp. gxy059]
MGEIERIALDDGVPDVPLGEQIMKREGGCGLADARPAADEDRL